MHLVGFIVGIFDDVRSPGRQIWFGSYSPLECLKL